MAMSTDLNIARKNLADVLGDSMKLYLQNLNSWFKRKGKQRGTFNQVAAGTINMSTLRWLLKKGAEHMWEYPECSDINKEEFDFEARKLMRNDTVHLHNEFLLALIAKCHILSSSFNARDASSSGKVQKVAKVKKRPPGGRANLQQRFIAAPVIDYVPQTTSKALEEGASPTPLGFVAREGLMPDMAMVHGRMLVCAWETGLADVQEAAVNLLMLALETQLKHILSLVVRQRKGYKLREGKFVYSAGVGVKNPYYKASDVCVDPSTESTATTITPGAHHAPSLRPSVESGEDIAAEQYGLGVESLPEDQEPISLYDLCDTLMLHKNAIVSHSVYAPTIERIIHMKWHPSHEDLKQDDIHHQEVILKHKLANRRDFDEQDV